MGILDNNKKVTYLDGLVDLQDLHKHLDEKLGKKYEVKFLKKGSVAQQMMGGENFDQIFIAKNTYHRTLITLNQAPKISEQEKDETHIHFNRDTLKWWLKMLNQGFIGGGILRLIYGSNKDFDGDIIAAIQEKYNLTEREINVGLSALWKKDKNA